MNVVDEHNLIEQQTDAIMQDEVESGELSPEDEEQLMQADKKIQKERIKLKAADAPKEAFAKLNDEKAQVYEQIVGDQEVSEEILEAELVLNDVNDTDSPNNCGICSKPLKTAKYPNCWSCQRDLARPFTGENAECLLD